jgi:nicotinamide-nucleotide amidase
MIAEIVSVGTELLLGQIVNTDAQYLAQRLSEMGIDMYHQVTVGDNRQRVIECIKQAYGRSDIVITTGGLGPTQDDLTKEAVAEFFGLPLEADAESEVRLRAHFAGQGREMTPNNLRQIYFPQGCLILKNDYGTAPGCVVERDGKCVIVLPGPPNELQGMFRDVVLPYLRSRSEEIIVSRVLRVFGLGESTAEHLVRDLIEKQTNPTIAPYASFGEMSLRLTVKCRADADARALLDPLEAAVRERLGDHVYAVDEDSMEGAVVHRLLAAGNKKLATAESCTGGLVAAMLTNVPGASEVFHEGFVTYANEAKMRALGVSEETLASYGAVSEQTAREMAQGAREKARADYGLAVTGIAGPGGGSEEKPVGLVYVALATEHGTQVVELRLRGTRERIRRMSALNALDMVRRELMEAGE